MEPQGSPLLVMQVKRKETERDSKGHGSRRRREVLWKPKKEKVS